MIFLGLVAAVFVYFLVDARSWPIGAALLPTVVACAGLVLLVLHIADRLRPSNASDAPDPRHRIWQPRCRCA